MPLVYPPNFEGVRLTYEYVGVYANRTESPNFDDPRNALPLTAVTGTDTTITVGPETCFFYFQSVPGVEYLLVRGFVNASVVDDITVRKNNDNNTYYLAYAGSIREEDTFFIHFNSRMALSETFSGPIDIRVFLETGRTFLNNRVNWRDVPECGTLGYAQNVP